MILAIRICPELPPEVIISLILRILEVVFAVRRRLPDVNDNAWDALLGDEVGDGAVHEGDMALVRILDYAAAELTEGGVGAPEGAKDGGGGREDAGFGGDLVGDFVNEAGMGLEVAKFDGTVERHSRFKSNDVRNTLPLISLLVADLAHRVYEVDAHHPLVNCELDLSSKIMDMFDQSRHDLPSPRCGLGTDGVDDILSEVGVKSVRCFWCHCDYGIKEI
jgi:hypothetical protein